MKPQFVMRILGLILPLLLLVPLLTQPAAGRDTAVTNGETYYTNIPYLESWHLATPPIFGVQVYGGTGQNNVYYDSMLNSGTSWIRNAVYWDVVEPSNTIPENYEWGSVDSSLSIARPDRGGLNMIITIEDAPIWASQHPDGPIEVDYLGEFAEFMGALAERFDGDGIDDAVGSPVVNYWELYNEPDKNFSSFPRRWGDHGAYYAQMLQTIHPVMKAANPKVQIVMGGIAYDAFVEDGGVFVKEFLPNVLAAGGGDYFDVMNFHSYPAFFAEWTTNSGPGLYGKAQAIRGILAQYGHGDKPLIVTEAGWHSNSDQPLQIPGSPLIQARYVVELGVESLAAELDISIWWMLYDPPPPYPFENGLVKAATAPAVPQEKVAFETYQRMTETLRYMSFSAVVNSGYSQMEVFKFENLLNGRPFYVAWMNPVDNGQANLLSLTASRVTVTNSITGGTSEITGNGQVTVSVGASPLYIQVEQ